MASLIEKIGAVLLTGFHGSVTPDPAFLALVRERKVGNYIFFARNLGTTEEITGLIRGLRSLALAETGAEPLLAVDQEGGMVSRLQRGGTWFPGAMASAAAVRGRAGVSPAELRSLTRSLGSELWDLGFNLDLAPVADVNSNPDNPVIGVRSYGDDPSEVGRFALQASLGLQDAGLLSTAKHFPGHGDTNVDSHFGLPSLPHGLAFLEGRELVPFRTLVAGGVDAVMSAHVLLPGLVRSLGGSEADQGLPATLNPLILRGLLRQTLGFEGLIISDCLTMKAIADHFPDAPVQTLLAGCDLVCVSHGADVQTAAAERIQAAVRSGRLPEAVLDAAYQKVLAARRRVAEREVRLGRIRGQGYSSDSAPGHREVARRISRASLCLVQGDARRFQEPVSGGRLYIDIRPVALHGADDQLAARTVGHALEGREDWTVLTCSTDPGPDEVAALAAAVRGRNAVVVGLYDASRYPGQRALVEALRAAAPLALLALRSPYDGTLARKDESVVLAWEYTPLSVETVGDFLCGAFSAEGGCPVRLTGSHPRPSLEE